MMCFIQSYSWFLIMILCLEGGCSINEKPNKINEKQALQCSADKLVVKGYDIYMSFVVKAPCFGNVKFIEVFALNNLYFDADFDATGKQVQLSLIAPNWIITEDRKIILNGKNGEEYKSTYAPDGIGNFRHGRPGKPGGSAGKLLGIAYSVMNESKLKIFMNGGIGGPGQHGGKGINGIDGEDPPLPKNSTVAISLWESVGFIFNATINQNITNDDKMYNYLSIRVFGRNPTKPGDGGHGGVGGRGGYAGSHTFVALNGQPKPSIFANSGKNGSFGNGGQCGSKSQSGFTLDVFFRDEYSVSTGEAIKFAEPSPVPVVGRSESFGVNGTDDCNDIGIDYPDSTDLINPANVINNYKNFVRKSIVIDHLKADINLIDEIDNNEHIQSLYNTLGLIDEMMGIETQYFDLKTKASPTPYFRSLLKRTEKLAQNLMEPIENKGVLTWLYTVIMTRISTVNTISIVDLPEYLNEIEADILKLHHIEREANVEFQENSIISEIQSISVFIKNHIFPEIENIFVEISSHVMTLINELYERQYKFKPPTVEDVTEESIIIMSDDMLYSMYMEGSIMIGAENEIICSNGPTADFSESEIGNFRTQLEKYQLLKEQLNNVERELYQFSKLESESDDLGNVTEKVAQLRSYLSEQLQNCMLDSNDIDLIRDELISVFEKEQDESHDSSSFFDKLVAILYLNKDDEANTLVELSESIQTEEEVTHAYLDTKYIYDTILEMFLKMETSMNAIVRQPITESHFGSASKLRVIDTIRNVKAFFRKLGNETAVMEYLIRSIEKLDDTIVSLYEAYDHIDRLNELISFNRLANPISAELQYSANSALNAATKKLEKMIQTNIILEKYESAVKAFRRQQFPFANKIILSDLKLPEGLQHDDNEKLAKVVIDHFYYLKNRVKSLDVLIGGNDRFVFRDIEFSDNQKSFVGSFFRWSLIGENEEKRKKLLRGEEIELTASIRLAKPLSAVKFSEIGIGLITSEDKQRELNSELEKFIVTMTMTGNMYYRCNKDIYHLPLGDNISFTYSFKRDSTGKPLMTNDVYDKVYGNKNGYLSPYTTWKIQIQKLSSSDLTKFDQITLELFGRGQYIQCIECLSEICDNFR